MASGALWFVVCSSSLLVSLPLSFAASPSLFRPLRIPPLPAASSSLPTFFTSLPLHSHAVLRAVGTVGAFIRGRCGCDEDSPGGRARPVAAENGGGRKAHDTEFLRAEFSSNPCRRRGRINPLRRVLIKCLCDGLRDKSSELSAHQFSVGGQFG